MIRIREATLKDNDELQELQSRCPQGTTLIVSTVNTPDFFARVKTYENYKVFIAYEGKRLVGSSACAIRNAIVNGELRKVGHQFQLFVDPEYRGRGIAGHLHKCGTSYLTQQGAVLSYALIIEGNIPSIRHSEKQGFRLHRTLVMPGLAVFKEMSMQPDGQIRTVLPKDLNKVANLLNETWQDHELYEPVSAESLARFILRTPAYSFDSLYVLENNGQIQACLGFWDWSQVTQIIVKALTKKMRIIGLLADVLRFLRPMPRSLKIGDMMKQMVLSPIGFKEPSHLTTLLRHINNLAFVRGIETIFFVSERNGRMLKSIKGFIHIDTAMHLYIKPLQKNVWVSEKPSFVNAIDF